MSSFGVDADSAALADLGSMLIVRINLYGWGAFWNSCFGHWPKLFIYAVKASIYTWFVNWLKFTFSSKVCGWKRLFENCARSPRWKYPNTKSIHLWRLALTWLLSRAYRFFMIKSWWFEAHLGNVTSPTFCCRWFNPSSRFVLFYMNAPSPK